MRAGEIVGLAGIDGNGQTELIDGDDGPAGRRRRARCASTGSDVTSATAHGHFEAGLGHIPEDRQRRGLVLEYSIAENIALHDYRSAAGLALRLAVPAPADRARAKADQGRSTSAAAARRRARAALSGGNQQKVVLAREIERDPKVLIAAQPTRGLDVGAIEFVHRRLIEERDEGRAILLVSLELEEVLSLSDRILVDVRGRDRRRVPADRDRGGARHRDDRRRARRGGRVSDAGPSVAARRAVERAAGPDEPPQGFAERLALAQRAGGLVAPLLTVLLAFVMGGLVVLVTTGKNPLETYQAIFEGSGLNWFFPWVTGTGAPSSPRSTCSRR